MIFRISVSAVKENRRDLVDFLIDEVGFNVNAFGEHLVSLLSFTSHTSKKLDRFKTQGCIIYGCKMFYFFDKLGNSNMVYIIDLRSKIGASSERPSTVKMKGEVRTKDQILGNHGRAHSLINELYF